MSHARGSDNSSTESTELFGGLRARIIALVVIALAIPIAVAALMLDKHSRDETRSIELALRSSAHDLARDQAMLIAQSSHLLSTLARQSDAWLLGAGCMDNFSAASEGTTWALGLAVASPEGIVICGSQASMAQTSIADRAYFQESVSQKRFVVSDLVVARGGLHTPSLLTAQPVLTADGRVRHVLLAALRADGFVRLTEQGRIGHQFDLALMLDRQGALVAQHPPHFGTIGEDLREHPLIKAMLEAPDGVVRAAGPDGIRRIYGFAVLPDTGGVVVVARDESAIQQPIQEEALATFGILLLSTLLAAAAAWWFAKVMVLQGITEISQAAQDGRRLSDTPIRPGVPTEVALLHRALLENELRRAAVERRWQSLGAAGAQVIWSADSEGRAVEAKGRSDLLGVVDCAARGLRMISPASRTELLRLWRRSRASQEGFSCEIRTRVSASITGDGAPAQEWRWALVRGVPVFDARGDVEAWVGTVVDVHEARLANLALKEREARLRSVLDTAADSVLVVDDRGRIADANPAAERTFGWMKEALIGASLRMLTPPELAADHDARVTAHAVGGSLRILGMQRELEGLRKDGSRFPLEIAVTQWRDGEGRAWYTGIMRDISARRKASQALAESEARFRLLAENSGDVVALCTLDGVRRYVSPMCETMLGWKPGELVGKRGIDFVHPDDRAVLIDATEALFGPKGESSATYRHRRPDGSWIWIDGHARREAAAGSAPSDSYVVVLRDASARVAAEQKLQATLAFTEQMASTDGLTGLTNRRQFDAAMAETWARCQSARMPLSVLMVDADRFKMFNDRYGHLAGDDCLRMVSAVLRDAARRPGDVAARYGGEEFILLLPNTDAGGALHVAQRLRYEIEARAMPHATNLPSAVVTVSIGVAIERFNDMDGELRDPGQLVAAADKALYDAKSSGRNRVVLARTSGPTEKRPSVETIADEKAIY